MPTYCLSVCRHITCGVAKDLKQRWGVPYGATKSSFASEKNSAKVYNGMMIGKAMHGTLLIIPGTIGRAQDTANFHVALQQIPLLYLIGLPM